MTGPDADAMAPQDCQDDDLLARESTHGWHVVDRSGEIWYPSDEAAQKIAASPNPGATALAICRDDPMRGYWVT